jgi:hypothetical protein
MTRKDPPLVCTKVHLSALTIFQVNALQIPLFYYWLKSGYLRCAQ